MTTKANDVRYVTAQIPADEMARLVQIAAEDGRSVTVLVQQWIRGGIRDYPRKEAR
jgi:hypothetical protein